jgi:dipeptidyl aminopeptidase/acylaminoacyl peptidase
MRSLRLLGIALCLGAVVPSQPVAQNAAKRPLAQADWDRWRSITGAALSADGRWAAYTLVPQVGDGELVVRSTSATTEYRIPRGYIGRPNNVPGGLRGPAGGTGEGEPAGPTAPPGQFTADSRFVLVMTQLPKAEVQRLEASRPRGGRAPNTNRSTLVILNLADGRQTAIPRVRSFRLPRDNGQWLAYVPEADSAAADSARGGARPGGPGAPAGPRRSYGSPLVIRNLSTGAEERIEDVLGYVFDDSARVMAYTVVSRDSTRDGAFIKPLGGAGSVTLLAGRGNYKSIALDRAGTQTVFLSDRDEFGRDKPRWTLYYGRHGALPVTAAVTPASLPEGLRLADNAGVSFTRSGNGVLFGVAPPIQDSIPADSLRDKAVFDLWHWQDPTLQPTQKLRANQERNRSFQAIWYPGTKKLVQLASDSIPSVSLAEDARVGLASSGERYRIETMWGDGGNDIYTINPLTGAAKLVREKISGQAQLSPDGKYVLFFDRGRWYSHATATGRTVDLTGGIAGVSFEQETWDTPSIPGAWGIAGWVRGDRAVLLNDRWDVWEIDPAGVRPPVNLTDSLGRREQLVLRLVQTRRPRGGGGGGGFGGGGAQEPFEPGESVLLRAVNEETKASGFYRDRLGAVQAPERIVMADAAFGAPLKADDAEQWLVTRGTFTEFPNLYAGPALTRLTRISDANPQQSEYNWGTVELVRWFSSDGVPLKGLLYKPENFDPSRQYPMVVYFYESLSQNYHSYIPPNGRNVINPTHYVSNGYLVFEPDIHYEAGYPGPSAEKSIIPGVQMLLARGYVNPKAMGLQGQSWGGYQALYLITQTNLFAAAMAGAPVVNMTSAYGGIRWGSGLARAFQYEVGQSRIGGSLWEAPMRYFENSPLFWLDKVTTPLMMMHNDMDDAVPWYQGIETFVALRRLGKEVYLVNYNNDVHNPASRANQKDIAMRMQQFFDTKLRGMPAPDWMVRGIPYLAKGRDQLGAPAPVNAGAAPAAAIPKP